MNHLLRLTEPAMKKTGILLSSLAILVSALHGEDAPPAGQKPYIAQIVEDKQKNVIQVRISILKSAFPTALQSIFLTRSGADGTDLYVPIAFRSLPSAYEAFLILPLSLGENMMLQVSHEPHSKQSDSEQLMSITTHAGPTFKIPIKPTAGE